MIFFGGLENLSPGFHEENRRSNYQMSEALFIEQVVRSDYGIHTAVG